MPVRPAELEDLRACLSLDHSYVTERVWQMDLSEENGGLVVGFHDTRLPRPVKVNYPRDQKALLDSWHHRDCFLVATPDARGPSAPSSQIIGYLNMDAYDWHGIGWVADLVIAPAYRRQGIARQLLQAGINWARDAGLGRLIFETQTRNHPAIRFLEKNGFSFCGYNDRFYANQEIALFFSLDLR
jgi:ribosomal protein S18 acetylase RimI-like enzyme